MDHAVSKALDISSAFPGKTSHSDFESPVFLGYVKMRRSPFAFQFEGEIGQINIYAGLPKGVLSATSHHPPRCVVASGAPLDPD
jgi:hypothetical protein